MASHRWMKFWPQDFENDPALRICSLAAQGLWIRMICRMHEGTPHGHLTIGVQAMTAEHLAKLTGAHVDEIVALLAELRTTGVLSETAEGLIFSRRMVRDAEQSEAGREAADRRWKQERERKGNLNGHPISPPNRVPNTQDTESESDSSASQDAPPSKAARNDRAYRLPDDWQPSPADREYAQSLGLDVERAVRDFRDYWHAEGGAKARKVNWSLTWQNRCRVLADRRGSRAASSDTNYARNTLGSFL